MKFNEWVRLSFEPVSNVWKQIKQESGFTLWRIANGELIARNDVTGVWYAQQG